MSASILDTRRGQMFPVLEPGEIDRTRRFGTPASFAEGELLYKAGEISPGMFVILKGEIVVSRRDATGTDQTIIEEGPGAYLGELAQLSGRPALVNARAKSDVDALVITGEKLRALLVAEAELGERIMRSLILRRMGLLEQGAGPIILGRAGEADVLRLEGFLSRNGHPYLRLDPEIEGVGRALMDHFKVTQDELPVVVCAAGHRLVNPSERELGRSLGMVIPIDPDQVYDVAIVGAGPAGLATAVYAASEGLSVLALDCRAFGGQAGASARIENYLGFPTGITGMSLMARANNQALKFGATMAIPDEVVALKSAPDPAHGRFSLVTGSDEHASARCVVIASGARYRRLEVENLAAFEGSSVHYWASPLERNLCTGSQIALIGGGNSAGQAVVYLSAKVAKLWLVVRGPNLDATMSHYLVERISSLPNVELVANNEVVALEGHDHALEAARWRNVVSGVETRRDIQHMFLFIGAEPNTDWLNDCNVLLDDKGFVRTGADVEVGRPGLATSRDGVFAVGDVRAGSTKRVAAAVGEGAQVVAAIHTYLASTGDRPAL